MDTAVRRPLPGGQWTRLTYPDSRGMDLAFVITPEPTVAGLLAGAAAMLLVRRRAVRD